MSKIGLEIKSHDNGFIRKFVEDSILCKNKFEGLTTRDKLDKIFPIGSGVRIYFETTNITLQPQGNIKCSLDGVEMVNHKIFTIRTGRDHKLKIGDLEFTLKALICR